VSRAAGTKHLTAVEIELQHPAVRFTVSVSDPDFRGLTIGGGNLEVLQQSAFGAHPR
jgi:hypothetical protein